MRRNNTVSIILILSILVFTAGCSGKQDITKSFNIPEAEKIQQMLDDMSLAIMENNGDVISNSISENCPGRKQVLDTLTELMSRAELDDYFQTVIAAKRLRDGVVCTVNISLEGTSENKDIKLQDMRNIYFLYENATWKIGDYNYHPYMSPTIIVGSESTLYDAAYSMSEALDSKLRTDTEHLQSYGDIIMVGTPYDNASILDLEEKGLTITRVTDDYPDNDLGIVQVISNVENYRHVIIIQGNETKAAQNSIRYMTQYLKDNPYLNPGVYFIEDRSLRTANPLELTTLVTLDAYKSSRRLKEAQKQMEASISVVEEEFLSEKEQLDREQRYLDNKYHKDYPRTFSRYEFYPEHSLYDSMVLINANFTDSSLCTSVFELPYGDNVGTAYAYAEYIQRKIKLSDDKYVDDKGPLLGDSMTHTLAAHEIVSSANKLEISALSTALLRLSGFSENEVYSLTTSEGNAVFLNIDGGYSVTPGSPVVHDTELQLPAGKLISVYNDGAFLSYEYNTSNLDSEEAASISDKAGKLYILNERASGKAPEKVSFGKSELSEIIGVPYDSDIIYNLLRNTYITDDSPCLYSTLDEAREQLRSSMGRLLAMKCTRYMTNAAARHPFSQFDQARYTAGLINVENPNAYAEAAENSLMVKELSGGIANLLSDASDKTMKIIDILDTIAEADTVPDRFLFPDYCIINKTGSHRDKALLAFGLYSRLTGSSEDTYIVLGENSSYLAFMEEDRWKYLDCKFNTLREFLEDDIYAVFNKDFVYNKKLDTGYLPDIIE